VKLGTNVHHMNRHCWKGFRGQRLEVKTECCSRVVHSDVVMSRLAWSVYYALQLSCGNWLMKWLCCCSVPDTSGLHRHREHHDREAPQPGQWHRVVMEEPQHGQSRRHSCISKC